MKIYSLFLDLIAPKKCYSCKKEGHFICPNCFDSEIDFNSVCYVCKGKTKNYEVHETCKSDIYYNKVIILKHYKSKLISKIIKDAKFYNKKNLLEDISHYLYEKFIINEKMIRLEDYTIVSTPSHFLRRLKRGYNTSDILCKHFSKISFIDYKKEVLIKTKNTRQQSKMIRNDRLINLQDSFKINKRHIDTIRDKNIIIIDDVISTGTTLNEISKLLKTNGAKYIIGLIVASD
ncbi:MAG: phosphoribosyltransferase family protein [Candidatus Gracilibacteria bacterium]|nr:phosphoribosyltransferase family protein [Candidatus Gracilibacteria bacterium]